MLKILMLELYSLTKCKKYFEIMFTTVFDSDGNIYVNSWITNNVDGPPPSKKNGCFWV